jgi:hypothetical protein
MHPLSARRVAAPRGRSAAQWRVRGPWRGVSTTTPATSSSAGARGRGSAVANGLPVSDWNSLLAKGSSRVSGAKN